MLGRLFKLTSTQSLNSTPHGAPGLPTGSSNSFEDSYTRGILYGCSDLLLPHVKVSPRRFRVVIAQDGGGLAAKQVLFDLFGDSAPVSPQEAVPVSPLPSVPDLPSLHHKLSQVSLLRSQVSSPIRSHSAGEMQALLPPLDAQSSPNQVDLTGQYFSRENEQNAAPNSSGLLRTGAASAHSHSGINRKVVLQKPAHNINTLADYMFGRGLPSNEWHMATKVHVLPLLNLSQGTLHAVLVTRLFLIVDPCAHQYSESEFGQSTSWSPSSTLCARDSSAAIASSRFGISLRANISSRFSIGLIIPFDDPSQTIEETLSSNWESLCMHLAILQKVVTSKLIAALKGSSSHHSQYISNKRILFPSYMFQGDLELLNQFHKIIKLISYQVNVPRLINSHSLMMYTLEHAELPYKANMINWALEVINWLEFKDGRNPISLLSSSSGHLAPSILSSNLFAGGNSLLSHFNHAGNRAHDSSQLSNTFLASLFALIISLRDSLSALRIDINDPENCTKNITRVVVMTSNSTVAKKLVFILCGLIPDSNFLSNLDFVEPKPPIEKSQNEKETDDLIRSKEKCPEENGIGTGNARSEDMHLQLLNQQIEKSRSTHENPDAIAITSPSYSPFRSTPNLVRPIPIQRHMLSESDGPSDDSVCASLSSTKGWEVPVKSTISASFSNNSVKPVPTAVAQKIPYRDKTGGSMAYLSSSLNSSLSSSASNYSLLKLGSSFMDKRKHSLVGANPHQGSHQAESFEPPMFLDSLRKSGPAKSPSPGLGEDHLWDSSLCTAPNSPLRPRFSRNHSVFNMCKESSKESSKSKESRQLSTPNIGRTGQSVYVPTAMSDTLSVFAKNEAIIRTQILLIFESPVVVESQEDPCLVLKQLCSKETNKKANKDESSLDLSHRSTLRLSLQRRLYLQPHVAFVDEFRPECVVQSCPVSSKLEAQVIGAMKHDLNFYQNTCGYKKVVSKTVFVSLRARDIKLIELYAGYPEKSSNSHLTPTTPTFEHSGFAISNSPLSSYFSGHENALVNQDRRGSTVNNYKTSIRKVFSPGRSSGDRDLINSVEARLERLAEVVSVINGGADTSVTAKQELNRMLLTAVREIIS